MLGHITRSLRRVADAVGALGGRSTWSYPDRIHLELLRRPVQEAEIESRLQAVPGVRWARVNVPLGRAIVALDDPPAETGELMRALDEAEAEAGERVPGEPPLGLVLAADVGGIVATGVEWLIRRTPLPAEAAGLLSLVDNLPRLREAIDDAIPLPALKTWLPVASAAVQGLAPGMTGLAVDLTQRLVQLREGRAAEEAWHAAQESLTGTPERAAASEIPVNRPVALPPGPAERYADRLVAGAPLGGLAGALLSMNVRRGLQTAMICTPKAAFAGRETFAAELGTMLSRRGVVIADRRALRRLDRIDTVVFDEEVLLSPSHMITEVKPAAGADHEEVATWLYRLFGPDRARGTRQEGPWRLRARGSRLTLTRDGEKQATAVTARRRSPHAEAALSAARSAGLRVVVRPGVDAEQVRRLQAEGAAVLLVSADGPALAQADCGVGVLPRASVSAQTSAFTHASVPADCGAVVPMALQDDRSAAGPDSGSGVVEASPTGRMDPESGGEAGAAQGFSGGAVGADEGAANVPWGADVLLGGDLVPVVALIAAVPVAREVAAAGVRLARAGTAVAALLALTSPAARSAAHALSAVHVATCLSMGHGAWRAWRAARTPVRAPADARPWHAMPVEAVLHELDTDADGLSTAEAARRRRPTAGHERPSLLRETGAELANPFTPVLAAGAAGSAALGSLMDAVLVSGVVGLSALVGGGQRRAAARTLADLARHVGVPARVLRDGKERDIDARDLVPGDVVALSAGQVVPADCRIVAADGLEADESALTGESLPVAKDAAPVFAREVAERGSMLYESTSIAAGTARAVVVAVGEDTQAGRAMAAAEERAPRSGVAGRLAEITRATAPIALGSAAAVALAGLVRGRPLRQSLGEGVNLAVAAVPEGLPLLVSAAQLAATRRLSAHGVHVRDPRTVEALGRVEVLCFDKTGTLTAGEIRLARVCGARREASLDELSGRGAVPAAKGASGAVPAAQGAGAERAREPGGPGADHVHELGAVLAAGLRATPGVEGDGEHSHLTDAAVAAGAEEAGVTRRTGARGWRELAALPFEPSRGFHATLGRTGRTRLLSVKGAPETVLPRCARVRVDGEERPMDDKEYRRIEERVERLAASGHRVLAVAEHRTRGDDLDDGDVTGLTFVGLLGLADAVRHAASPAVARLRAAGVQIVMITGDHPSTAAAIAAELIADEPRVLTGAELDDLDDADLDERLPSADVVARCTPEQKVRVVRAFQRLGKVVAMTGDGANDAAGIRLADVGIALGGTGTPAARAAADLVVGDDRLETIVSALAEGRAMWASVREALAILVGGNLGETGFTVLGALASGASPLSARQLLLVNMLTDLAPALAIALRAPSAQETANLLQEGPERSLGQALTRDITRRALITVVGAGLGWTLARWTGTAARARTVALVALVGTQLAQTLQAAGRDRTVLLSALGSAAALAAIVQTPGLSHFFGSTPLGPVAWTVAVAAVAAALACDRLAERPLNRMLDRLSL
ncbi:cation-translocating P-type ATPase [Nonomuraea sp. SYSU D8015]|uniref:cation-translocating P-type ATPase n=1 Tax=Nonomuraea sp. SYSU D8015 TaxID=2593644 RepID=UPI0016610767|nr:cation-translocating P-type ATPase [Nonomuraea sp. SYSU D8015]